jgi:hypothetical protein
VDRRHVLLGSPTIGDALSDLHGMALSVVQEVPHQPAGAAGVQAQPTEFSSKPWAQSGGIP